MAKVTVLGITSFEHPEVLGRVVQEHAAMIGSRNEWGYYELFLLDDGQSFEDHFFDVMEALREAGLWVWIPELLILDGGRQEKYANGKFEMAQVKNDSRMYRTVKTHLRKCRKEEAACEKQNC